MKRNDRRQRLTGVQGKALIRGAAVVSLLLLLVASTAAAGNKIYTNKDLERYENRPAKNQVPDFKAELKSSMISVDFLDAEVYQVLRMIAEEAKKRDGVEIFVSPEMSGRITIKMINVPWTEVLKNIEQRHNLTETFLGKRTMLIYQNK